MAKSYLLKTKKIVTPSLKKGQRKEQEAKESKESKDEKKSGLEKTRPKNVRKSSHRAVKQYKA